MAAFPLLVALTLFAACENPLVSNILPDRDGITYTVTFNKNGGDSDADPKTKIVRPPATTIDKMPEKPIWAGRTFIRWTANADGSGAVFTTATPVTADITVYAQWLEVPEGSFVVTFDSNGGDTDADPAAKVVTPPATNVGTLPAPPTWANHTFAGWNTQADGLGTAFTASTTVNANITVYAKWTQGVTPPPTPPVVVDFESDSIGKTYIALSGADSQVVTDPANAGQKSLQITSSNYNQAAVIPITLPAALNTAEFFTFRFNLTNGAISYKKILVYISDNAATFVDGAFGNAANNPDHYPEFAANKLGETEEFNDPTLNDWLDFEIAIGSLSATIRDLTGDVYLAIGINHGTDEAITYLLDDLTFTFGAPKPPPVSNIVDFENDALGATTKYTVTTAPQNGTGTVTIVADPANAGQKSLNMNSTGYNIGAIIPINLSKAVNAFNSFTFRFNMKTGTLENKDMMVYVADSAGKFTEYGFGNADGQHNFANLLLGQVRLTDVMNQWDTYAIAIENPGSLISALSGDVFLAIGINHQNDITYLLDDLTFSDEAAPPPPPFPTTVTFEDDDIGKTYQSTSGTNSPTSVAVDADPVASGQKSLKVVTNGSGNAWNQAAIIPINLPDALSTYRSFRFRFNLQTNTNGPLIDNSTNQPRKISVYVANNTAAFARYGFGNPSNSENPQFANLLVGGETPDYGETGSWVDYGVNFSSSDLSSAISGLSGNVYVAIGINYDNGITYYLDDLTFSKQELIKDTGGALGGNLTVTGVTHKSAVAGSVTAPGNGQTIEYSVSTTGSPGVWQASPSFTGLAAETTYTAYARAAANAQYAAGPVKSSAPFTTGAKDPGAAVSGTIAATEIKHNRIVINAIAAPGNGQTVEYAISTGSTAPESGWHTSTTFTRLSPGASYYVFARAKENDDFKAGTVIISGGPFTTTAYTPPVPSSVVDFEEKTVGDTYNRVSGQGSPASTAAVVADPDTDNHSNERSLQIISNGWNNGAIIPINLPFALKNYESFTFRYRLATSMPQNANRGDGIFVYVMSTTSGLPNNQLGNNNTAYTSRLLKNIVPDYGVTNEWVDHEIELVDNSGNSTVLDGIQNLSGDVFLVIGINSAQNITYQLDDLTFNIYSDFVPPPSLSSTSATFVTAAPADIPVTVNLYGNTLTIYNKDDEDTPLVLGTDYTVNGNEVTLKASNFTGKADGSTVTLVFTSSNGTSSEFKVTVRAAALLIAYDFANGASVTPTYAGSGAMDVRVGSGNADGASVLIVAKTNTNHSTPMFIIPFDLGNTTLANYSAVEVIVRGVSGDTSNKLFRVEVNNTGTFGAAGSNPLIGSRNNAPIPVGTTWETLTITNSVPNPATYTQTIYIAISLDNTQGFVYEIKSIRLVPNP